MKCLMKIKHKMINLRINKMDLILIITISK